MDIDQEVRNLNPWWQAPQRIEEDPHLRQLDEVAFRWDPEVLEAIDVRSPAVHTLRGPRQVGKTTTLKRIISQELDSGRERIGYFSFDLENDPSAILDVIRSMKRQHPSPDGHWLFVFDEVTQIEGWPRGVKYAWDHGDIREDTLILTGSTARDMVEGAELLPGRRGEDLDHVQLPMSFRSFCQHVHDIEVDVPAISPTDMLAERHRSHLRRTTLALSHLNEALEAYLNSGGMPAAVNDWLRHGTVTQRTLRIIWRAIAGDLTGGGLQRETGLKLIERVAISLGSPFAWTTAAEEMDVHRDTVKRYVRFLALGFTLLPLYFWDLSKASFNKAKQRKVYFRDPVFARVPAAARTTQRSVSEDGLVEGVVAEALFRAIPMSLLDTSPLTRSVGYWRATSGREIDFLADPADSVLPIELKWGDSTSNISNARKAISLTFEQGAVLTRSTSELDRHIPAIPTSVFLYLTSNGNRPVAS